MNKRGVTIIELMIALAALGVLVGLAVLSIRPGPQEVSQATSVSSSAITRARLEAIRVNGYSTVYYDATDRTLYICTADTMIATRDGVGQKVRANVYLGDDFPRVKVEVSPTFAVTFDRRGFARSTTGSITFSTQDGSTVRTLAVAPNGRITVTGG